MLYLLGIEGPAVPWIALVGAVTVVLFASVLLAARRRGSYATVPVALLAAAWAGVALASSIALWMFRGTVKELERLGGGRARLRPACRARRAAAGAVGARAVAARTGRRGGRRRGAAVPRRDRLRDRRDDARRAAGAAGRDVAR
jgi:hypothetical protein